MGEKVMACMRKNKEIKEMAKKMKAKKEGS